LFSKASEEFRSSGVRRRATGNRFPTFRRNMTPEGSKSQKSSIKIKVFYALQKSGFDYPVMRCHIQGERSPEHDRRENLKNLMASEINDSRLC
jgi:hypothetical protein